MEAQDDAFSQILIFSQQFHRVEEFVEKNRKLVEPTDPFFFVYAGRQGSREDGTLCRVADEDTMRVILWAGKLAELYKSCSACPQSFWTEGRNRNLLCVLVVNNFEL